MTRTSFAARTLMLVVATLASACDEKAVTEPEPQLGHLFVSVKYASNRAAPNIPVDLYRTNGVLRWSFVNTKADGTAEFRASEGGVLAQEYLVSLRVSQLVWPVETDTYIKAVTVTPGDTAMVQFTIRGQ